MVTTHVQATVREMLPEDLPRLEQMYAGFDPIGEALGLPPGTLERRQAWLTSLQAGINVVAVADDHIVGHLALMPAEQAAEMAVFVHQAFRRQGLATSLTKAAVELARARGLRAIWVLITSSNVAARNGLRNFGFRTAWESMGELQMVYSL
jgi:ribosomal protein S18 acetylase RimI-like enzyme